MKAFMIFSALVLAVLMSGCVINTGHGRSVRFNSPIHVAAQVGVQQCPDEYYQRPPVVIYPTDSRTERYLVNRTMRAYGFKTKHR